MAVGLTPVASLIWPFVISLREHEPWVERGIGQLGLELLAWSSSLWALHHGRYPTFSEANTISLAERGLVMLALWLAAAAALLLGLLALRWLVQRTPRRLRWAALGVALAAGLLWFALPWWPPPANAQVLVKASTSLGPWPLTGPNYSQGGEGEMPQPGYFETALTALAPIRPGYIRLDHLYDYYDVYHVAADGTVSYDWSKLDRVLDAVQTAGATPLLTLSYLPPALGPDPYSPPSDWAAWEALVYQTVYHVNVERKQGVMYWEVWNEPNLPGFWHGTIEAYLQLYAVSARGALHADPSIKLGGPATASLQRWSAAGAPLYEQNWVTALIDFTRANDLPLDFISWHYYDPQPANYAWSVAQHQAWTHAAAGPSELLLTEWNYSMVPAPELDTTMAAAHSAAVAAALLDQPVAHSFFFEVVNGAGVTGSWGLLSAEGDRKPVYWSHWLFSRLSGDRLSVSSSTPHVGALAARTDTNLNLLLWRLPGAEGTVSISMILANWDGSTAARLYAVPDTATPPGVALAAAPITGTHSANGELTFTLALPPNAVRLISLTR